MALSPTETKRSSSASVPFGVKSVDWTVIVKSLITVIISLALFSGASWVKNEVKNHSNALSEEISSLSKKLYSKEEAKSIVGKVEDNSGDISKMKSDINGLTIQQAYMIERFDDFRVEQRQFNSELKDVVIDLFKKGRSGG